MFNLNKVCTLALAVLMVSTQAQAEVSFVDILKSLTPNKKNVVAEVPELSQLNQAKSVLEAQKVLQNKLLQPEMQTNSLLNANQIKDLISQRTLTLVIVPGVLGEFIDTRAFEEVFKRTSAAKTNWERLVNQHKAKDQRFALESMSQKEESLLQLVNVASIDDAQGKPLVKLVILKTLLGSMESVGGNADKALIFNRRLQQYVNLTNDQNIILMGYSRGTPLALEMVANNQIQKFPYIARVKALVSYAGVISGSALADVTDDLSSESGRMKQGAVKLYNELQMSNSIFDRLEKRAHNTKAVSDFVLTIAKNSQFDPDAFLMNARSGDFKTIAALIAKVSSELGLKSLLDFNGHVSRTKHFIAEVLKAVDELKSKNREQWWKTHNLPKNIQYLSIAASMVDPDASALEKSIYSAREGYNDTLDDKSLIGNMRTYKKLTGVAMNDSQVALHQSLFLPEIMASLNANNSGLSVKALGVLQTHHWGVSLETVNKMKDGRLNPFPREKVLLALAAYLNQ